VGGMSQDMERNQLSKGHSLPGDCRGSNKSEHRMKLTKRGALTNCRQKRKGQVRTQNRTDQARGTHFLETIEGGTSHNTERNQLSKGHSHPRDHRGRDNSGHGKELTEKGGLTSWR